MKDPNLFNVIISKNIETHRVCLIFPVVEIVAVVKNVLVCGVETGFYAVLHHLACPRGALELLDLNAGVLKH